MKLTSESFLDAIKGEWKVIRQIRNYQQGCSGISALSNPKVNALTFIGSATCGIKKPQTMDLIDFKGVHNSSYILYEQKLELEGINKVESQQQYLFYKSERNKNTVHKLFSDGKPFEQINLEDGEQNQGEILLYTDHICKADEYKGTYTFSSKYFNEKQALRYQLSYRVNGKNKNYLSVTNYEKRKIAC